MIDVQYYSFWTEFKWTLIYLTGGVVVTLLVAGYFIVMYAFESAMRRLESEREP